MNGDMITGNGNIRTEKRNTGNFNSVKASGAIDVEISNGDAYAVSVEDDDNVLPYIITEVNNGVLNVHYRNNTSITNDHGKVYVTAPTLEKIISSGSADITSQDVIKNPQQITFTASGSGNIKVGTRLRTGSVLNIATATRCGCHRSKIRHIIRIGICS